MKFSAQICLLLAFFGLSVDLTASKDSICDLEPAANSLYGVVCLWYMPSWSFHPDENACKKFIYGGCGGNANRFESQRVCEAKCMNKKPSA